MYSKNRSKQKWKSAPIVSKENKEGEPLGTRYKTIPDVSLQTIPMINLQGLWLEDAGFWCGDKVRISVSHERIVIEPEKRARRH